MTATNSTLKITRKIAAAIRAACRQECGGYRIIEVGERWWSDKSDAERGFNILRDKDDGDLIETIRLSDMVGVEVIADDGGHVAFDCYCYTSGPDGELDTNVYVAIDRFGNVIFSESCGAHALKHLHAAVAAAQ